MRPPDYRASFKDDFELILMRWRYLVKAGKPTDADMKTLEPIARGLGAQAFIANKRSFIALGFDCDDVTSLARVYAVSYLGVFSIKNNPNKKLELEARLGRSIDGEDLIKKDFHDMIAFIKQRLKEAAYNCNRKASNLSGAVRQTFAYIGPKNPYNFDQMALEGNPEFKRIQPVYALNLIKQQLGTRPSNNKGLVVVPMNEHISVYIVKNRQAADLTFMDPAAFANLIEGGAHSTRGAFDREEVSDAVTIQSFDLMDVDKKRTILRKFISKNKKDRRKWQLVKVASQMLEEVQCKTVAR